MPSRLLRTNGRIGYVTSMKNSVEEKFMFRVLIRALEARFWAWKLDLMSILARDNFRFAG